MQLLAAILVCHARAWSSLRVRSSGQTRVPKASIRRPTELSTADDASSATIMDSIASMPSTSGWGDRTVGGVRLDRISRLVVSGGVAYGAYVVGNDSLDVAIVEVLGDRSVGAFGPFVTLLALIYSTILGSIFSQLSSRQGAIQDSLFAEAFAVRDVGEVCGIVSRNSESDLKEARQAILAHAETLRDAVDKEADDGADQESLAKFLCAVNDVDHAAGGGAICTRASNAYGATVSARSARRSALASTVPPIQLYSYVVISRILLAVFLLVQDSDSFRFDAVLFAILVAAFQLIESFVDDLADPFGGAWSVASARGEVDELVGSLSGD